MGNPSISKSIPAKHLIRLESLQRRLVNNRCGILPIRQSLLVYKVGRQEAERRRSWGKKMFRPVVLLLLMVLFYIAPESSSTFAPAMARPGCQESCGGIQVPFPFGMLGQAADCFLQGFGLNCSNTPDHKLFLGTGNIEVANISLDDGQLQVHQWFAQDCYVENGTRNRTTAWMDLIDPYKISGATNKLVAVGCDTVGYLMDFHGKFATGCASLCFNMSYVLNGTCSGIGCCETSVPTGFKAYRLTLGSYYNHSYTSSFNPCSYVFLADESFVFDTSIFSDSKFTEKLPLLTLEWAVGKQSCEVAKSSTTAGDYACKDVNSVCENSADGEGYRCRCKKGYRGNAYLDGGCQDIDECEVEETNECIHECRNTNGSYTCHCPRGLHGDGRRSGTRCTAKMTTIQMLLAIGSSILFLVATVSWLYWIIRKRSLIQLREKFFQQNGGLLLQQQISPTGNFASATRIFTLNELKKATDNYDDRNIIGKGGFGTVYKGLLLDTTVVAIKKSKISDQGQVEQFINEVVVLSNIIHRNVVKLLGCCLESEVPLLVYEFMSNGTLSDHLHEGNRMKLSLGMRLRIAAESAEALAYLHSSASTPIIHRDIKSSNILLDEDYTAKVSDFGTSRLVPFDRSCLNSLVRGTFGYLDPEYFHTGQFTDKSDVYSFGVVLVELLTGEKAISKTKFTQGNGSLANYFVSCMNENRLSEILDRSMEMEGSMDRILEVAELAKRCLQLKGDDRPTMRAVAMVLEGLGRQKKHPWIKEKNELVQPFVEPLLLIDQTSSYTGGSAYGESDSSYSSVVPLNIMR